MFDLPETITVWTKSANDGYGGSTWSTPVSYDARIAYKSEKFTDSNGAQLISTAVCYSEGSALENNSVVFFGTSVAATPPDAANDVKQISQTPSGSGDLKKAWFA